MFSEMSCTKFNTHVNTICSSIPFDSALPQPLPHSQTKTRPEPTKFHAHLLHLPLHAKSKVGFPKPPPSSALKPLKRSTRTTTSYMELVEEEPGNPMDAPHPKYPSSSSSSSPSSSSSSSTSRWNPTKEQINVLEGLYRQGLRTPSAEQIQQITSRLKVYGHIEGKNVFYWFQNHKARQRQKQKQDQSVVYISRYLRNSSPILPSPCTNHVGCNPYCVLPPGLTFYPQIPKVLLPPENANRRGFGEERTSSNNMEAISEGEEKDHCMLDVDGAGAGAHETLELFPLRPTGIKVGNYRTGTPSSFSSSDNIQADEYPTSAVDIREIAMEGCVGDHQRFFNFLA